MSGFERFFKGTWSFKKSDKNAVNVNNCQQADRFYRNGPPG
jgi:hypothetical protein